MKRILVLSLFFILLLLSGCGNKKYTVTWKNYDGSVLEIDNDVEYGKVASYNGKTPSKESNDQNTYLFNGWNHEVKEVTENTTYTATFLVHVETDEWSYYLKDNNEKEIIELTCLNANIKECDLNSIFSQYKIISIGNYAFKNCTSLTSIIIPNGVTTIGYNAFENCTNLMNINLPESLVNVEEEAFTNCPNIKYNTYDNALYLGNSSSPYILLMKAKDREITSCIIHNDTKLIYPYAFEHCGLLTDINIPDNIIDIGAVAFYNCIGLQNVKIGNNVKIINYGAFYHCLSLTNIIIPDNVINIGNEVFEHCEKLESVTFPKNINCIGDEAFRNCLNLKSIIIPDGVTQIKDGAFYHCTSLTDITIPSSVTTIGSSVFDGCTSLASITLPSRISLIDSYAFYQCTNLTKVNITDIEAWCKISFVGDYSNPLSYAKNLYINNILVTEVNIPESVTSINKYTFSFCTSLVNINIPNSVTSIEESAFSNCTNLISINIPESVTNIEENAFRNCTNLSNINIPESVTRIGANAFWECPNLKYNEDDNGLYLGNTINPYLLLVKVSDKTVTTFSVNNKTKFIHSLAFWECENVKEINIPDDIISIESDAFTDCSNLDFNDYYNGYYLGNNDNPNVVLIKVTSKKINKCIVHKNTKLILGYAFQGCNELTDVIMSMGLISIGDFAFYQCTNLININIPNSVETLGSGVFSLCSSLEKITIPDSITTIEDHLFSNCTGLIEINLSNNITSIGDSAFSHCISLKEITIPEKVTRISNYQFNYCGKLTNIILPNSIESIGTCAFSNCFHLVDINIPNSVKYIDDCAFINCNVLSSINIPNNILFKSDVFKDCDKLVINCSKNTEMIEWDSYCNPSHLPVLYEYNQ